jgi:hypothetical protein
VALVELTGGAVTFQIQDVIYQKKKIGTTSTQFCQFA